MALHHDFLRLLLQINADSGVFIDKSTGEQQDGD